MILAILTPMRDCATPEYEYAITKNVSLERDVFSIIGKPVDEARNLLVRHVLGLAPRPEYVAWIDDDAFFLPGTIERLIADLSQLSELSIVAPLHSNRGFHDHPLAARILETGPPLVTTPLELSSAPPWSAPRLERCDLVSAHMFVHRTSLLTRIPPDPFSIGEESTQMEDDAFCERLLSIGGAPFMDMTLPAWHVGPTLHHHDGRCDVRAVAFCPGFRPCEVVDGTLRPLPGRVEPYERWRFYGERVTSAGKRNRDRGAQTAIATKAFTFAMQPREYRNIDGAEAFDASGSEGDWPRRGTSSG